MSIKRLFAACTFAVLVVALALIACTAPPMPPTSEGRVAAQSTIVTAYVGALATDDAWHAQSSSPPVWLYDTALNMGNKGTGYGWAHTGLVLDPVNVPQGAQVLSATLFVMAKETSSASVPLRIYVEDADDAATFASDNGPANRTTMPTYVDWSPGPWTANTWYTCTITSLIQQVVNRPGWAFGNALDILIKDNGASYGNYRAIYSRDYAPAYRAYVTIEYAVATPTPTPTPLPTATPACGVISADTAWSSGPVTVTCNVAVAEGVTLTIYPGVEVRVNGPYLFDIAGTLYAVGTVSQPITFTHATTTTKGAWLGLRLGGPGSTLERVVVRYGAGLNIYSPSVIRYSIIASNTYGVALYGPHAMTVTSSTIQYNDYGILTYGVPGPATALITACNVLSNTVYDVWVNSPAPLCVWRSWWGGPPPTYPLGSAICDYRDNWRQGEFTAVDSAASPISW
ncbi:MAG: hypothetical protein H5T64_07105 [Chloroflexi bacterium]|nr:hypothetical protein [Chloroflexota bacterium]